MKINVNKFKLWKLPSMFAIELPTPGIGKVDFIGIDVIKLREMRRKRELQTKNCCQQLDSNQEPPTNHLSVIVSCLKAKIRRYMNL